MDFLFRRAGVPPEIGAAPQTPVRMMGFAKTFLDAGSDLMLRNAFFFTLGLPARLFGQYVEKESYLDGQTAAFLLLHAKLF